jgi:hypothetical protein
VPRHLGSESTSIGGRRVDALYFNSLRKFVNKNEKLVIKA